MNKEEARMLLMDYLYDEIDPEKREVLEAYLEQDDSLKDELNRLNQTRRFLQNNKISVEPERKMVLVETEKRSFSEWLQDVRSLLPHSVIGKTGFAIAASLVFLLIIGSVANMQINFDEAGFSLSLGSGSPNTMQQGLTPEQAEMLANRIQRQNEVLLTDYAESMYRENQEQLKQVVDYFHRQRLNDLQLIDQNLDQLQQVNNYRWQQTNEFLGEIVQTVEFREDK